MPNFDSAAATACGSMTWLIPVRVAIHPSTVPISTAASPPGTPPGSRTRAVQLIRMMPSEMKASHGTCQLRNAGRIEMKAMEIPASAPSIAARGVYLRRVGPTKAPIRMMMPMMKAQASPACQARIGSMRLQIGRQHHQEDDDEHVRHAGAVRQRRHVAAALRAGRAARRARHRTDCRSAERCRAPAARVRTRCCPASSPRQGRDPSAR